MANVDWSRLRARTQARIGLGRCGHALPTKEHLDFQEAHALARDAIWTPWSHGEFEAQLAAKQHPFLRVATQVDERRTYLLRPEAGRALAATSRLDLEKWHADHGSSAVVVLVSDGLSAHAMHAQGHALAVALVDELRAREDLFGPVGPVVVAPFGRVALSDAVGAALGATLVIHAIGERPGLSAIDSVALYVTYAPRAGNTDAERNCISNVREPHGLTHGEAIRRALFLLRETARLGYGGYRVKDDSGDARLSMTEGDVRLPPKSPRERAP